MVRIRYLVQHGPVIGPRREAVVYPQPITSTTVRVPSMHMVTVRLTV